MSTYQEPYEMSKKAKEERTNAVRHVAAEGIPFTLHSYDVSDGFQSRADAAKKTGMDPDTVFKTLVLKGHSGEHYVCVIPVLKELDLKKTAKFFGEKNVEMVHVKELLPLTGYVKGGCSPIGMKKKFPTAIHCTAENLENICVSGGKIGLQIELPPLELSALIGAKFTDLTKD